MDEIIDEVLESLGTRKSVEGDEALPLEPGQVAVPITKENFREIRSGKTLKTCFIDGGNSEIFGASSFSLQFVRIAGITYEEKRIDRDKEEFYLMIKFDGGEFKIKTFPDGELPELSFDSLDPRLRTGNERVVAQKIGNVCRRLAELKFALKKTESSDMIILDGDLYSRNEPEEKIMEQLKRSSCRIAGLSKTSGVMTKKGRVLAAALNNLGEGSWIYSPVYKGGTVTVSFAKFHPLSKHVFRLDTFGSNKEASGTMRRLANDPVFPGYPYPLIEADKHARVTNSEIDYLKTKLTSKFGKNWKDVKTYLHTKDAHGILDNIG